MNIPEHDATLSFASPVGVINLFAEGNKVVFLTMGGEAVKASGKATVLTEARDQLKAYFSGKSRTLKFAVKLEGTDFQKAVWKQIAKLPFGKTTTYAEIAEAIGNPAAVRAVGGAVGANPVPLVVGCHRVLGASGKITGYSGGDGIPTKKWLLAHENIEYKD